MKSQKNDYDVLIVGAGPAGVVSANLLGKYGVKTLLIDKEPDVINIPRAVGMCDEGSRILNSVGLTEELKDSFLDAKGVKFNNQNQETILTIDTSTEINGFPILKTFHQPDVERVLRKGLKRFKHVDFWTETECLQVNDTEDSAKCRLRLGNGEIKTITCNYVIACDGARSSIRKMCDIGLSGYTYGQDWIVIDADVDPMKDERDWLQFSCDPNRPGVTIPVTNGARRWEYVVKNSETPDIVTSDEFVQKLLSPWGNIDDMKLTRKATYRFNSRIANKFRKGRIFLVGDAAHLTPPFAGQGMMAGLRDSYNLCWKISHVLDGNMDDKFLDTYQSERLPQAKLIVYMASLLGLIILPQNKVMAKVRDAAVHISQNYLPKITKSTSKLTTSSAPKMQKIPNNIKGYLGVTQWGAVTDKVRVGFEFPQYRVKNDKSETLLFDDCVDDSFIILSWNDNPMDHLSSETVSNFTSVGGKFCVIKPEGSPAQSKVNGVSKIITDTSGQYQKLLKNGKNMVVIRPDKMVVINTQKEKLDKALKKYLQVSHCIEPGKLSLSYS